MLIPAQVELRALRGGTFDIDITLYVDKAQTVPFDLTGQTVDLKIDGVADLTSGHGLVIQASQGLISVTLTASQTAAFTGDQTRYRLKLDDGAGEVVFPIAGTMLFLDP